MDRLWRKCRQAYRDVVRAFGAGRAVANPLAARANHRLARGYIFNSVARLDLQQPAKHDCVFVKLRGLPRLAPSRRTHHASNARRRGPRVHPANEFLDDLRRRPRCLDSRRRFDDGWHDSWAEGPRFSQPRAPPWEPGTSEHSICRPNGPTVRRPASGTVGPLGRSRIHTKTMWGGHATQGVALGWTNRSPFGQRREGFFLGENRGFRGFRDRTKRRRSGLPPSVASENRENRRFTYDPKSFTALPFGANNLSIPAA